MKIKEIPVLLLTGYLGSGKTTLVNRILTNQKGIRFAVIVNDIGEVNIDADLIQKGGIVNTQDDSLVALQNGCICCSLKMDLVKQLHDITVTEQFDYIVIEASGICEPAPIAQTICSIPEVAPAYAMDGLPRLDCIATVVDALRLKDEFNCGLDLTKHVEEEDLANLVIQQIEFCNIIVLNKVSEVTSEELGRVRQIIRAIQPKAAIIETDYCEVELDRLIGTGMFDFDDVAGSAAWVQGIEDRDEHCEEEEHEHHHHHHDDDDDDDDDDHDEEHEHHHHHHHHHHEHGEHCHCHECEGHNHTEEYGISTFVYMRRRPMDLGLFDEFVARHWPKGVIRAKGMVYFEEEYDMCYVFEQAGRQINMKQAGQWFATMPKEEIMQMLAHDPHLQQDWDEQYGDRMQKLVFIGQNMNREEIEAELDKCLV